MASRAPSLSSTAARGVLLGLGFALVGLAIVVPIVIAEESPPATVLVTLLLIGGPAVVLIIGTIRLRRSEIDPRDHQVVLAWTVGLPAAVAVLTVIYDLQPTVALENPTFAAPTLLAVGCAAGFAVGRYDASARTRERELDERNRELEAIREELEDTVEQLEASNERLEQFAYAVSHDLEEPLRTVSSYLQLVESRAEEELSGETLEYLEFALDGADRMREMIEGLLTYSRVETEASGLEPVDLSEVVAAARESLHDRIERSDATLEVGDLPTVLGDEHQLRQVFQNLLDNAIEYSGDEPPEIRIRAEPHGPGPHGADQWRIVVRDEGVGIPEDVGDRVFEVFERVHVEGHEGTGIGLAIARRIVRRHGGEIWFESESGEGTTFHLTLHAADGRDGADGGSRTNRRQATAPGPAPGTGTTDGAGW